MTLKKITCLYLVSLPNVLNHSVVAFGSFGALDTDNFLVVVKPEVVGFARHLDQFVGRERHLLSGGGSGGGGGVTEIIVEVEALTGRGFARQDSVHNLGLEILFGRLVRVVLVPVVLVERPNLFAVPTATIGVRIGRFRFEYRTLLPTKISKFVNNIYWCYV